ncbi:MAG TPA: RagB/SusD family nutrient uptake outer membrane protein [Chitinophaga sp.]|uniref:RagB/SusD family nutrient uptake outer membrane protein n=1 Tax=Chitinophaga sp. TaxID=1869181 RepID=UPI002C22DA79|nr:RagB/SusD family nutrient uptake outer membrane protein [Chitinophaga sp.]HVI43243.1 RagB/SusD family nutrient uptake outer membrane protein [Chitinophaga sp.]
MRKYSIYIVAAAITGLGACQKNLLDPVPTTNVPDFSAFETKERIAGESNGLYTVMKNGKFLGGKVIIANEVRGEDFVNELTNNVTLNASWKMSTTGEAQEVKEIWSQGYMAINNANVFLAGMNALGNKVVGDSIGKIYAGDAKFVRGLTYMALAQLFTRPHWDAAGTKLGLVLRWEAITKLGSYGRARSTVNETWAQIIRDLDSAEVLLPKNAKITGKGNAYSAVALKTRAYLYMEQYDKVIAEAGKIVSATAPFNSPVGYKLEPSIATVFTPKYGGPEAVLSMPFTQSPGDFPGTQTQLGYYFSPSSAGGNGEYSLSATGIIADAGWKAADARRTFIVTAAGKSWLLKYPQPSPYLDYIPVIRYAEVLLNLAEAKVRVANAVDPTAIAILNAVRNRSDASTTFTAADFGTPAILIAAIQKEKHIELLGEGFRAAEIIRQGIPFPLKSSTVPAVPPSVAGYIWPISSDELVYNKLCVDNL